MKESNVFSILNDKKLASLIRKDIIELSYRSKAGHTPSALSMSSYLLILFRYFINPYLDRLVLGKPYGAQAYYSIFFRLGWIENPFDKYCIVDENQWSYIIDREHFLIDFIDDTMGNALSVGCGMAFADKKKIVFINISDGYLQEGTAWEGIAFAGYKRLNNIVLAIDNNGMQATGYTNDILSIEPLELRLKAFGWEVTRIDGTDITGMKEKIESKFDKSKRTAPLALIFDTIKGLGVDFMKNNAEWHYRIIDEKAKQLAINSLVSFDCEDVNE